MSAIADTSFIVETALTSRQFHLVCLAVYRQQNILYVPQTALAETLYFLHKYGSNNTAIQFLENVVN